MQLVLTTNSEFFIKDHIEELSSIVTINRDVDEWKVNIVPFVAATMNSI